MIKRKVIPSKRPSTTKVTSKLSNLNQRNGLHVFHGDVPTPKTRFSLNDRSRSSPRLKSFPAEQIKRLEISPQQNPPENVDMSCQMQNSGQGDTLVQQSGLESHQLPQTSVRSNQNVSSPNDKQVPRVLCPVNGQVNQSELAIPSPMRTAANERPPHRPHVPQANMTFRDQSPRKPVGLKSARYPENLHQTQMPGSSNKEPHDHQNRDLWLVENDSEKPLDPDKESVEAKPPDFYRRSENINVNAPIPQSAGPNFSHLCPVGEAKPTDWSQHQQNYQRHQPNVSGYYNNNVQEEMSRRQYVESTTGMTSPQDFAMNRKQNWQRTPMQLGPYSQGPWIQNNNNIQQQYYPMNTVTPGNIQSCNPDSNVCYQQIRDSGIQVQPNQHNLLQGIWQPQQQHYYEQAENSGQPTPANNLKTPGNDYQQKKEDDKGKALRFSPAMIKDQEMLVTTMRQQGISEDIMRCQFDALLAEQRKQLLYLEQLERGEPNVSKTVPQPRRVQRKISKIEDDGKPEWMLHITPPRIPYSVIEKMRSDREVHSERNQNAGNSVGAQPADVLQQYDQIAPESFRQTCQNIGSNSWQQPMQISHDCRNPNVINRHQTWATTSHHGQHQMGHCGSPMQQQVEQQHHHMYQLPQEKYQDGLDSTNERIQQVQGYQQAEMNLEPSSLMKIRHHKQIIRQQKQNNGLQDPETVQKAMEALKHSANRKGLEYLDNLNKKPEKPVSLNGAQDTQDLDQRITLINGLPPEQHLCQPAKMPSANGLENHRNPNNLPAPSILYQKKIKEPQWPEYPRQRTKNAARDCYSLIAERENGTIASSMPKDCHKSYPAQNLMMRKSIPACPKDVQSRLQNSGQFPGQFPGQVHQNVVYNDGKPLAAFTQSIPLTSAQHLQKQYHTGQMQQFYGNPSNFYQANGHMMTQLGFPMGGPIDRGNGNVQLQKYNKNNEIQEMIVSGGLKYLARKPEYMPRSSASPHQNVNPGQ